MHLAIYCIFGFVTSALAMPSGKSHGQYAVAAVAPVYAATQYVAAAPTYVAATPVVAKVRVEEPRLSVIAPKVEYEKEIHVVAPAQYSVKTQKVHVHQPKVHVTQPEIHVARPEYHVVAPTKYHYEAERPKVQAAPAEYHVVAEPDIEVVKQKVNVYKPDVRVHQQEVKVHKPEYHVVNEPKVEVVEDNLKYYQAAPGTVEIDDGRVELPAATYTQVQSGYYEAEAVPAVATHTVGVRPQAVATHTVGLRPQAVATHTVTQAETTYTQQVPVKTAYVAGAGHPIAHGQTYVAAAAAAPGYYHSKSSN